MEHGFKRTITNSMAKQFDIGPRKKESTKEFAFGPKKKESNKDIAFMLAPPLQGYKRKNSFSRATEKSEKKM